MAIRINRDVNVTNLVRVFHEFGEVQQGVRHFRRNLGSGQGLREAIDQVVLLLLVEFRPARKKSGVEEVPATSGTPRGRVLGPAAYDANKG